MNGLSDSIPSTLFCEECGHEFDTTGLDAQKETVEGTECLVVSCPHCAGNNYIFPGEYPMQQKEHTMSKTATKKTSKKTTTKTTVKKDAAKDIEKYLADFGKEFLSANQNVKRMAEIYVAALKKDRKAGELFAVRFPTLTPARWERLRLIGYGDLEVEIWHTSDRMAVALMRVNARDRSKLFAAMDDGVDIVSPYTGKVRKVSMRDISASSLNMLIDKTTNKVRSLEEQRRIYREKLSSKKKESGANLPYFVNGGCIETKGVCHFMQSDVRDMLIALFDGNVEAAAEFVLRAGE